MTVKKGLKKLFLSETSAMKMYSEKQNSVPSLKKSENHTTTRFGNVK